MVCNSIIISNGAPILAADHPRHRHPQRSRISRPARPAEAKNRMVQQLKRIKGEYLSNSIPWGKRFNADLYRKSKVGWFLRQPNWKNIQLQPFEKNLYKEHPATASRSIAEVEAYRKANGVSVKGNDVPKPILAFDESNFPDFVLKGVEARRDSTSPTCIEAHCWPIALSCRNFLAIAQTGIAQGSRLHPSGRDTRQPAATQAAARWTHRRLCSSDARAGKEDSQHGLRSRQTCRVTQCVCRERRQQGRPVRRAQGGDVTYSWPRLDASSSSSKKAR
ncbi:hypothetical protein MTO96_016208 [Rhipicephalus appendiculatus]